MSQDPPATDNILEPDTERQQVEDNDIVTLVKIESDIANRMCKVKVLQEDQLGEKTGMKVELNKEISALYINGIIFARYMLALKRIVKRKENQDLNIDTKKFLALQTAGNEETRSANWNIIGQELDKIGISLDDENKNGLVAGDQPQIDRLFLRIERYMKIIAGADFLKFDNLDDELIRSEAEDEIHDIAIVSDTQSQALSHQKSLGRQLSSKQKMVSQRSDENNDVSLDNSAIKIDEAKEQSPLKEEQPTILANYNDIKIDDSQQEVEQVPEAVPVEEAPQPHPVEEAEESAQDSPEEDQPDFKKFNKTVKDGVDIINMDVEKPLQDCDSSLDLILVTLSRAFKMKPKQTAALLTNNNKYLVHACVKGVKGGRYEPVLNWYSELVENSWILANLLELESEQLPDTSKQTFVKVLNTLGSGFYSYCYDVVALTFQLFKALYIRFSKSMTMIEQTLKWFLSTQSATQSEGSLSELTPAAAPQQPQHQNGGLKLSLYAIKRHFEATPMFMESINIFCQVKEQLTIILRDELVNHTSSTFEYIKLINDLIPFVTIEKDGENGLIDHWVELCAREAENDGKHHVEERIAALSVLAELWLKFTEFVDSKQEMASTILFMLKRAVRERSKSIRMATTVYLFKLLDKFSESKNPAAPTMYKTLIFALIENPNDPTVRELFFANFKTLFEINPSIPIGLLVEPLIKQITMSLNISYVLKVFDFDFFVFLVKHPKCSPTVACQLLEMLQKVAYTDLGYSLASQGPICTLIERYKDNDHVMTTVETLIAQGMDLLLSLEPLSREDAQDKLAIKQKREERTRGKLSQQKSLPSSSKVTIQTNIGSSHKRGMSLKKPPNPKTQSKLKDEDVIRKLKKSLIVTVLIKIQNLNIDLLNYRILKPQVLETQKQFIELYGYHNQGLVALLRSYGDPDKLMQDYVDNGPASEYGAKSQPERSNLGSPVRPQRLGLSGNASQKSLPGVDPRSNSRASRNYQSTEKNTKEMAIVPYQEAVPRHKRNQGKSQTRARAMKHIEQLASMRKDKEEQKQKQLEKVRMQSAKRRRRLKNEIEKRKIELGIPDKSTGIANSNSNAPLALIYREGGNMPEESYHTLSKKNPRSRQVQIFDINEEEDADKEAIADIMKQYSRLWRNLFAKYQNVGFKPIKQHDFDKVASRPPQLTQSEVIKLLKDHGFFPTYVSKDEISNLIRMINMKNSKDQPSGVDLQALTYQQFVQFIPQLSLNCLQRPPKDLSHLPASESLTFLISVFEQTTKAKGLSLMLYEIEEKQESQELQDMAAKCEADPDYILPEGYSKTKERKPIYSYDIPAEAATIIGESKVIVLQTLDEMLSEAFGFHFLERRVTYEEKVKVKEAVPKARTEKDKAPALNYMRPVNKEKLKPIELERQLQLYQPDEDKSRRNAEAKENYLKKMEERKQKKKEDEEAEEERKAQEKEEQQKKAKQKRQKTLAQIQETKERLAQEKAEKQERDEELKRQKEEEEETRKEAMAESRAERVEFMQRQKTNLQGQFRKMSKDRQALNQKRDILEQKDQEYKKKLREQVEKNLQSKQKDQIKKQMQDLADFLSKAEVKKLFDNHNKGLSKYFSFYCLQGKSEIGFTQEQKKENLHFKEFVKFGYQSKIAPVLVSSEDVLTTFRVIARHQESERKAKDGSDNNTNLSQYINFESFKKAIVRLAIIGQEQLGGQTEEQKKRKEEIEKQRRDNESKKKERIKKIEDRRKQIESETLAEMRKEFEQKKAKIEEALSRSPTKSLSNSQSEQSIKKQKVEAQKQAEEEEFKKWLKQQEAVGNGLQNRVKEKIEGSAQKGEDLDDASSSASAGGAQLFRIRSTYTQSQIQKLEKQASIKASQLKGDVRDGRQITKDLDIETISYKTIKALFTFMGIEENDLQSDYNLEQKLNSQRIEVSGQKPTLKIKKTLIPERLGTIREGQESARQDSARADSPQDKKDIAKQMTTEMESEILSTHQ